jgi:hypothetical protein
MIRLLWWVPGVEMVVSVNTPRPAQRDINFTIACPSRDTPRDAGRKLLNLILSPGTTPVANC